MKKVILGLIFLLIYSCKISYKESVDTIEPGNSSDSSGVYFKAKICLQGAHSGTPLLTSQLAAENLLPVFTPLLASMSDYWVSTEFLIDKIDWVRIELFQKEGDDFIFMDSQSGLLDENGDLFSSTSLSAGLYFSSLAPGTYYVNVITRNHLSTGAENPLTLSSTPHATFDIDFTDTETEYLNESSVPGERPYVVLGGAKCLARGDLNQDQSINTVDEERLLDFLSDRFIGANPNIEVLGFFPEDLDFSGSVQLFTDGAGSIDTGTDLGFLRDNLDRTSQIYTETP